MSPYLQDIGILIVLLLMIYITWKGIQTYMREGLENISDAGALSANNGIAGNAATYAASIKATAIKKHDQLLISKYRKDYETVILNMDDLLDNVMLETVLSVDAANPSAGISKLSALQNAKQALNGVMKFVDNSA